MLINREIIEEMVCMGARIRRMVLIVTITRMRSALKASVMRTGVKTVLKV